MESNLRTEDVIKELRYIILFLAKTSIIIMGLTLILGVYLCSTTSESNCLLRASLLVFGVLEFLVGLLRFLFYSSYSSGFDAIWTPQMQGEIQRDERERQMTGWPRAATGAIMLVLGILTLMLYVNLFVST